MRRIALAFASIASIAWATGCGGATPIAATATTKPLPEPAATAVAPTATEAAPTASLTSAPDAPPTATPSPQASPTRAPTATPAASPTPQVALTPIGSITAGRVGEEVTVEGTVVDARSFSAGFCFTLDDGSGQIELLMWHNVYDDCWDAPEINLGARVRAAGEIGQYEGQLQLEPDFGGDVKAIEGAAPSAPQREIGSISGADAGQRVTIEGQVVRLEGPGTWTKVFVGDESGEIVVFIYANVLERIPDNTGLGTPGSRVRVIGTVEVYEGNLELIPTLPYDVMVLETP